ncbi:recombinase family protein [Candidatus Pacearchaeota archaeon]|nr:recombinase family protein [Candidatus Pacearchaeota archaeon]
MTSTKCIKCGYESEDNLEKFRTPLCSICFRFCPFDENKFKEYVSEKINGEILETFRKFSELGNLQKKAMEKKASKGFFMSRPAFGYMVENKQLVPAQNFREVEEIFEEFLNKDFSLRNLAQKRGFSVNGIKKILTNFTYLGKIKFNGQIYSGSHTPIVSSTLFNHVQDKIEKIKKI